MTAPSNLRAAPAESAAMGLPVPSVRGRSLPAGIVAGEAPRGRERLTRLSLDGRDVPEVDSLLAELSRLPFVESVLGLPDRHQKAQMEVPSSIGIVTRDVLVPEFTSVAVNDGMGVVLTDLEAAGLTAERIGAFFNRIGSHAAGHVFDTNRYSLSEDDFRRVLTEGGRAVAARYGFDPSIVERMENGACVEVPGVGDRRVTARVPWALLHSRFSRSEMGLNFGGNHFLELQVVDQILDRAVATRWGLEAGQVIVMYHLGPGPFSGTLLHHFSRRTKLDPSRAPFFFLSKLLFHYGQRARHGSRSAKWRTHFRSNRWTPIRANSEAGEVFRAALAMATNFGYAYRLATVRAIFDGLRETISPSVGAELLCDVSHNGIFEEQRDGGRCWVARHNACRLEPGRPAIVAGAWDVPSQLGIGEAGAGDGLHSYDHGAGHLIERARAARQLGATRDTVLRLRMTRGRGARVLGRESVPVLSAGPLDGLMECFADRQLMRSVVRLRPIGNFKN